MRFFSQCLGVDKKVQSADSKGDRSCNKDYLTPSTEKESKKKKIFLDPRFRFSAAHRRKTCSCLPIAELNFIKLRTLFF